MVQLQPDVIIIDVFNSTDFLALYQYRSTIRILFCNPMLSTYRVGNWPIVSEGYWPETASGTKKPPAFSWKRFFSNTRGEVLAAAMRYQWHNVQELVQLSPEHAVTETPFTRLFQNVPELVLAPLEFELSPDVRQPWQHYLAFVFVNNVSIQN